jgi:4-amino-4-deoxy-L-arabinose transferase-like glycosyltransferase
MNDIRAGLRSAIPVACCVLAAAVARLPGIAGRSLWGDEAYSLAFAGQDAGRIVSVSVFGAADVHPPLYYLLLKAWGALFGGSDAAARSLSLVLGCVAVAGVYLLGRQLLGRAGALAAGLIAALSPCFVQSGGEVRMYSLLGAAAVFAHLAFARLSGAGDFRRGGKGGGGGAADAALWAAACLAGIYTHHLGWLVPLSHWGFLCWRRLAGGESPPSLLPRLFRLQALVILLAAPVLAGFLRQAGTRAFIFDSPPALVKKLAGVYLHFSMGYHFANFGRQAARAILADPLSAALLGAAALGAAYFLFRAAASGGEPEGRGMALAAAVLLIPVVFGAVFFQLNLGARYLSAAAPGFVILIARGVTARGRGRLFWPAALLLAAANIVSLGTAWRLPTDVVHREDWQGLAAHLEARVRSGEFVGCENIIALRHYYSGGGAVLGNAKALALRPERYAALGGRSLWVQAGVDGSTPAAEIARREEVLAARWRIAGRWSFGRDLLLYRLVRPEHVESDRLFMKGDADD